MSTKAPLKRRAISLGLLVIYPFAVLVSLAVVLSQNFVWFFGRSWEDVKNLNMLRTFIGLLKLLLKGEYSE